MIDHFPEVIDHFPEVIDHFAEGIYVHRDALAAARERIATRAGEMIDVGHFKEYFGLSRKIAIPLLEWMDREGVTKRVGDSRKVL